MWTSWTEHPLAGPKKSTNERHVGVTQVAKRNKALREFIDVEFLDRDSFAHDPKTKTFTAMSA